MSSESEEAKKTSKTQGKDLSQHGLRQDAPKWVQSERQDGTVGRWESLQGPGRRRGLTLTVGAAHTYLRVRTAGLRSDPGTLMPVA